MNVPDFVSVMKDSELGEGKMRGIRVKGKPVLLAKVNSQVYAIANLCPHASCSLHEEFSQATWLCAHAMAGNLTSETGNIKRIRRQKLKVIHLK